MISEQERQQGNSDRVYELQEHPFNHSPFHTTVTNMGSQVAIFILSIIKVLSLEDIWRSDNLSLQALMEERALVLPIDLSLLSLFVIAFISKVDYIGCNSWDYWQYLTMRLLPFLVLPLTLFQQGIPNFKQPFYICLAIISLLQFLNFCFFDYRDSMESQMSEKLPPEIYEKITRKKTPKNEVIENSSKRMKLIVYCEYKNGGI